MLLAFFLLASVSAVKLQPRLSVGAKISADDLKLLAEAPIKVSGQ